MKRTIAAVFAFLMLTGISFAQVEGTSVKPQKTPEQRAENFTKRMTKKLALDAAQTERVKAINLDRFKQIAEAKSSEAADKKDVAKKVKAINETYTANLKGVLSPEQFAKFQELKEDVKEKAMRRKE